MKILFLNAAPDTALLNELGKSGIEFVCQDTPERLAAWPNLVVLGLNPPFTEESAERLRQWYPDAYLALVVPQSALSHSETLAKLLHNSFKDDLWETETWNARFGLHLQRAVSF